MHNEADQYIDFPMMTRRFSAALIAKEASNGHG
jgi:hypothetical protein